MEWNHKRILSVIADLSEENPFACSALYRIAEVSFTSDVQTLAVSLTSKPVLYINKEFLNQHASSEEDVKALLMHEFLHVILQHTEKFKVMTPTLNIALDAIINSIIHRTYGTEYSDFFKKFYKPVGIESLLRPIEKCNYVEKDPFYESNKRIYEGKYAADDLYDLLEYLQKKNGIALDIFLLGGHGSRPIEISPENEELLKGMLQKMNGTGIWSKFNSFGDNDLLIQEKLRFEKMNVAKWKRDALPILEKCLIPEKTKKVNTVSKAYMPILSSGDRKAFATYKCSPFVPFSELLSQKEENKTSVNIYIDVSGSMNAEIKALVSLLHLFRDHIRKPIWAFSNKVEKAEFKNGQLEYKTSIGTSISCVFDHIKKNKSCKNLIITDGYVEKINTLMTDGVNLENLRVIISAQGNGQEFAKNNIKYFQLKKLPV